MHFESFDTCEAWDGIISGLPGWFLSLESVKFLGISFNYHIWFHIEQTYGLLK
jgi:hypothetical protein